MAQRDDDEDIAPQYEDDNRAFLQAFLARGTLTFDEARPILAAMFTANDAGDPITSPDDVTEEDFASYLAAASLALSPFDYEIRSTVHQVSKRRIYALVNSTSDALTQLATTRSTEEIAYLKRLLDAMFETYNTPRAEVMAVTSMQALKVTRGDNSSRRADEADEEGQEGDAGGGPGRERLAIDKGVTHSQAERLLASLVLEGWFERSRAGWYTLSARALLELRSWLVATYNTNDEDEGGGAGAGEGAGQTEEWQRIKTCGACKSIVTIGQRCDDVACLVRLHDICEAAFWRTRGAGPGSAEAAGRERRCPRCDGVWTGKQFVGERAITTKSGYLNGRRRSGTRKRTEQADGGVDGEDEGDEDEVDGG